MVFKNIKLYSYGKRAILTLGSIFKIIVLTVIILPVCQAELRDPTKPIFYSTQAAADYPSAEILVLSSIWMSGRAKRVTINGVTAKQGETILSGTKIITINQHSVLVEQDGHRKKLSMAVRSYKKRVKQR